MKKSRLLMILCALLVLLAGCQVHTAEQAQMAEPAQTADPSQSSEALPAVVTPESSTEPDDASAASSLAPVEESADSGYSNEMDLTDRTIVQVSGTVPFQVTNAEGESFVFEDAEVTGDMQVYGMDFNPGDPVTFAFVVPDSDSFSCTALGDSGLIRSFSAVGTHASGSVFAWNRGVDGWKTVTIDAAGEVTLEP